MILDHIIGHSGWVTSVSFSPDGNRIVSGSNDETLRVWDVTTGAIISTMEGKIKSYNMFHIGLVHLSAVESM